MKIRDGRSVGLFRHRQPETAFTAAFGGPDQLFPALPGSGWRPARPMWDRLRLDLSPQVARRLDS